MFILFSLTIYSFVSQLHFPLEKLLFQQRTPPPLPLRPPAVPKRTRITSSVATLPSNNALKSAGPTQSPQSTPSTQSSQSTHSTHSTQSTPIPQTPALPRRNSTKILPVAPTPPPHPNKLKSTIPKLSPLNSSTLSQTHIFGNGIIGKNNFMLPKDLNSIPKLAANNVTTANTTISKQIALPTIDTNNTIVKSTSNTKISLRQDSSVSSDSFSQTSSPSYTTKTMETPLLPNHVKSCLYNSNIYGQPNSVQTTDGKDKGVVDDVNANSTSITKSVSTPASLQTIVRFHNGSNMSLHHRVSLPKFNIFYIIKD